MIKLMSICNWYLSIATANEWSIMEEHVDCAEGPDTVTVQREVIYCKCYLKNNRHYMYLQKMLDVS